jgi:N-acetylmuramoyl-L-alanine amidase
MTMITVIAAVLALAAPANAAATLRAVRQITTPATTRLIVELSETAQYHLQRVAAHPEAGVPARLYVDLVGTHLANASSLPNEFGEGPLLRLRATQAPASTTRLILDVPGLTEFGAFPMLDPFRLVIDVRGAPRAAAHPRALSAAEPRTAALELPETTERRTAAPVPQARKRLKIVLDPGHGGKDPGAIGAGGVAEKDVTLAIARRLQVRLASAGDLDVILTRDDDRFVALEERTARANREQADLFVSIHTNGSTNDTLSGVETYYLNNTNDRATIRLAEMENGLRRMTGRDGRDREASLILSDLIQSYKIRESVDFAGEVQHAVVDTLNAQQAVVNDLGVKRGPFYVLVGAGMPCVLVEVSFLTHPIEGARLAQGAYQESIAAGLSRGIRRFVENTRMAENL